jgi:hypothetical protein
MTYNLSIMSPVKASCISYSNLALTK